MESGFECRSLRSNTFGGCMARISLIAIGVIIGALAGYYFILLALL
jgi:hypothetical protein